MNEVIQATGIIPADHTPALPTASRDDRYAAPAARRGHRILALLQEDSTCLNRRAVSVPIHELGPGLGASP
ncbi:hypothetical protein ABZ372_43905 [Streptomyces sp. NPDC005921]